MNTKDQSKWREDHIPYRVRAALARTPLQENLLKSEFQSANAEAENRSERDPQKSPECQPPHAKIRERCEGDAIWEGRLAAIRWLIEFVGIIADKNANPKESKGRYAHDTGINDLGGKVFNVSSPEANKLAKVWLGCSQASSHATHSSGHPQVNEKEINEAMKIIMTHLDHELYSKDGQTIASIALRPSP